MTKQPKLTKLNLSIVDKSKCQLNLSKSTLNTLPLTTAIIVHICIQLCQPINDSLALLTMLWVQRALCIPHDNFGLRYMWKPVNHSMAGMAMWLLSIIMCRPHEHSACITHICESLCCETNHRFAAAATHVFVIHEECKEHLDQSVIIICKCVFSLTVPLPKTSTVKSRLFLWLLTALMWPTCRWLQPLAMSECSQRVSNGVLPSVQPVDVAARMCISGALPVADLRLSGGWL